MSEEIQKKLQHPPIRYVHMIPLAILYLMSFGVIWTGISSTAIILMISLCLFRSFIVTAAHHRYFSHKTFKTSRIFQFILAFLAQTAMQKGVVWWANHHRLHHKYSDTEYDAHSPRVYGFWYAHFSWIYTDRFLDTNYHMVNDLKRYPDLMFLDRYHWIPGLTLAAIIFLFFGWQGVIVGFVFSTIISHHITYCINSICHLSGKQRYLTGDDSRNNWLFALLAFGEGWHNNHHFYPNSARQGFFWWEIDISYYILKLLSWVGLIWDLRLPPKHVINNPNCISKKAKTMSMSLIAESIDYQKIVKFCESVLQKSTRKISTAFYLTSLDKISQMLEQTIEQARELPPYLYRLEKAKIELWIKKLNSLISTQHIEHDKFIQQCRHFIHNLAQHNFQSIPENINVRN